MNRGLHCLSVLTVILLHTVVSECHAREPVDPPNAKRIKEGSTRRGGFTGPNVPSLAPLLGDYANIGVRTSQGRTDIPRLLSVLKKIGAKDYMHLVWTENRYPSAWKDFQLMAPAFQKEGIRLWLYLTPPSEGVPEPFGGDYIRWAAECGKIGKRCPMVSGICIDDFNGNVKKFTASYCREMMDEAHKSAPHLSFLVVCYFGYQKSIAQHVEAGVIDGVIFPYRYPHRNHSNTDKLLPQIKTYRTWLDERTKKGGLTGKMPLVVVVYGTKHFKARDAPTPAYVSTCIGIAQDATRRGLADGVVTYCLPKNDPKFTEAVSKAYATEGTSKKEK